MAKLTTGLNIGLMLSFLVASQSYAAKHQYLLGTEGGVAARRGELKLNIAHPAPGNQLSLQTQEHNDLGFQYGLLAGYEILIQEYVLGLEGNISWQDFGEEKKFQFVDILGNIYNSNVKFERDYVPAVTLRAGYTLAPWITTYIRAGFEYSRDSMHVRLATAGNSVSFDEGQRHSRFLGGFGFQFPITSMTSLRFEYNYVKRKELSASALGADGATLFSPSFNPHQHTLKLAFVLGFDPWGYNGRGDR